MLYIKKPKNFTPKFDVVNCYIIDNSGKILLLKRHPDKSEGGKWGPPAGKIEQDDDSIIASVIREISEETGLDINDEEIKIIRTYYLRYIEEKYDYIYRAHKVHIEDDEPLVTISTEEHTKYTWIKPRNALLELDLVKHEDDAIRLSFNL
jgi:8-oxo-dGTP pyrophosphatase MutT (NUDIX family)